MKVLLIKTSSMGDVLHTLPALTDAVRMFPSLQFDWVVEEGFAEIPAWHSHVNKVIPVAWRRWRKSLWKSLTSQEFKAFLRTLKSTEYDFIVDAQGLLKSSVMALMGKGIRCGYNFKSAREPLASLFYQQKYFIPREQHAVTRIRQLMAQTLNYQVPAGMPNYGIKSSLLPAYKTPEKYVVLVHGTSRETKLWPVAHWQQLAQKIAQMGYEILIPWGSSVEQERAKQIAKDCSVAQVLPKLSLSHLATILKNARAIVAVDTGLGHLAAALDVPTVSLYAPTNPALIGTYGQNQHHIQIQKSSDQNNQPKDLAEISVDTVWLTLQSLLTV